MTQEKPPSAKPILKVGGRRRVREEVNKVANQRENRVTAELRVRLNDGKGGVCVTYDAENIPKEKRDLIEKAGDAFLNQAEEILNQND